MGQRKAAEYVESLWNQGDDNLLRLFFGRKLYFMHQVEIEKTKLAHPDTYNDTQYNVRHHRSRRSSPS